MLQFGKSIGAALAFVSLISPGSSQTIYATAFTGPSAVVTLYSINPSTGSATAIGPVGFTQVSGIAFDRTSGVLYGVGKAGSVQNLITINTSTGAGTAVGPGGITNAVTDLTFRPSNQTLYGVSRRDSTVWTFNEGTGAGTMATTLVSTGDGSALAFSASGMDALAIAIPEPAAYAAVLGGVALGLVTRRVRSTRRNP